MNHHRKLVLSSLVAIVSCLAISCSQEEYGPCSIPDTTAHRTACSPIGDAKTATCAADYVFDCESMICGRYDSSDAFCTHRCVPKESECGGKNPEHCKCPAGKDCVSECPDGAACVEWIAGTGAYYCLPQDKGCKSGYSYAEGDVCKTTAATPSPDPKTSTSGKETNK